MFFLFGARKKSRCVEGGQSIRARCPTCEKERTFHEVELETTYTAYVAIDLLSMKDRAYACASCGQAIEEDEIAAAPPPPPDPAEARKQLEAKKRGLDAKKRELDAKKQRDEKQIDRELAELKKKLGR